VLPSTQDCCATRETLRGPHTLAAVVLRHRLRARRQDYPWLLRRSEDVDVRRKMIRLAERADADETHHVAHAAVVAPQRDPANRTARDLLTLAAVRRRVHHLQLTLQQFDA